jgi:hypothetical protein
MRSEVFLPDDWQACTERSPLDFAPEFKRRLAAAAAIVQRRLRSQCGDPWLSRDLDLMRILLVGIDYAPDLIGVAKYNTELCESLVAEGHEVRVVTAPH